MIQVTGFRRVCPIHLQHLWNISSSAGLLLVPFTEFFAANGLRPSDLDDSPKAHVDEFIDLLF